MALDVTGDFILLAGRRHIAVGRLNDAAESLVKLPRNHKYQATVAEWNPTSICKELCAITTSERVEQMRLRSSGLEVIAVLKHHTRQVTDLSWHRFEPHLLATASIDSTTLVWDSRDTRKPVLAFTSVGCVNNVRWNKLPSHLIATAHDGDLRIWDDRKSSSAVQYIAAHAQKIHGIDWSEAHEYQLASCSQDCSVRLFDVTKPKRAESVMQTAAPVWRARYTPWGEGLVTAIIPSASGESSLLLWNVCSHSGPVHTFGGPLDVVVEFQWRREGEEFQLVMLSRDQSLRVWRIEPSLQRLCSYVNTDNRADSDSDVGPTINDMADTDLAAIAAPDTAFPALEILDSSAEEVNDGQEERNPVQSLQDEFDRLSIPSVTLINIDSINRTLLVSVSANSHQVKLLINFPPTYPYNVAPSFEIEESSLMDPLLKAKLLKALRQTAQQRVRLNRTCLENCLTQVISILEVMAAVEERVPPRSSLGSSPARVADAASVYSSFHDAYIPYPRSSGVRFCSVGMLVCFCRPMRVTARPDSITPRSLSAATTLSFGGSYIGSYPRYPGTGSSQRGSGPDMGFFLPDRQLMNRSISRTSRNTKLPRTVSVYDASKLFFVHKELAEKYRLNINDIPGTCLRNASAAASIGRQDLVQVWNLAMLAAAPDVENGMPWNNHPFSSSLIDHMIQHYAKVSDIQTAAMLSCLFPGNNSLKALEPYRAVTSANSSPYHTIHPADTSFEGWQIPVFKKNRSNSWSESAEEVSVAIIEHRELIPEVGHLPSIRKPLREEVKRRYGDMLHMWGLLDSRTQVLKLLEDPLPYKVAQEFKVACQLCNEEYIRSDLRRNMCHHITLRCSFCHVLVKGVSIVCMACGHGGHATHMTTWFGSETLCPTGCGCMCSSETSLPTDVRES